jgi:hypothetical protein
MVIAVFPVVLRCILFEAALPDVISGFAGDGIIVGS